VIFLGVVIAPTFVRNSWW